ncbi:MAG: heme exporter protein CcmD [Proteobacteria bacterium]|jgi:heme exporter protein D|nr:heme exporter protein CcmD [Pseudomonadota bacterium]
MPDLGKYAETVLGAYGVSILVIIIFVLWTARRAQKVKQELGKAEARSQQKTRN